MTAAVLAPRLRVAPGSSIRSASPPGSGAISLALGEPTWFDEPTGLPEVARRALASVASAPYGTHVGDLALRRVIAAYEGVHEDEVLVTCGAQGALFAAAHACLGEGAVALVPDPGFPAYPVLARLAGAEVRPYSLAPNFELDAELVVRALDAEPAARALFLNHPGNPTGGGASRDALAAVLAACRERGVRVISDEVYRELFFADHPVSARRLDADAVVIGSVSKSCGAPGLRVGWLLADSETIDACRGWHAWAVTSASWPAQQAARALLEAGERVFSISRGEVVRRWRIVADEFRAELGESPPAPVGGFYLWFRTHGESEAFCRELRDTERVTVVPGTAFGRRGEGWARLSFAAPVDEVARGARRVARFLRRARERAEP